MALMQCSLPELQCCSGADMGRWTKFAMIIGATALSGCATMPPEAVHFYFPRAETSLSIIQTVGCTDDDVLVSSFNVTPTTTYASDIDGPTGSINYGAFGGTSKDADVTASWTDDGRLSGVNASNTGEGSAIVKDAVTIVTAAASAGALFAFVNNPAPNPAAAEKVAICKEIGRLVGADKSAGAPGAGGGPGGGAAGAAAAAPAPAKPAKVISLVYTLAIRYSPDGSHIYPDPDNNPAYYFAKDTGGKNPIIDPQPILQLIPDLSSQPYYNDLLNKLPGNNSVISLLTVKLQVGPITQVMDRAIWTDKGTQAQHLAWNEKDTPPKGFAAVQLNRHVVTHLLLIGPGRDLVGGNRLWEGGVPVPIRNYYPVLVPTGRAFGKQGFALTLSSYGSITKLQYAANTGAAEVLDTGGSIVKALPTDGSIAASDQATADKIYERQRKLTCQLDATKCVK